MIFLFKALLYPPVISKPSTHCLSFDATRSYYQPTNARISFLLAVKPFFSLGGTAGKAEQARHLAFNRQYQLESPGLAWLQSIPTGHKHQPRDITGRVFGLASAGEEIISLHHSTE